MTPRWQLQQGIPARFLRQGAYKQQLRHSEEAELELVRRGLLPCAWGASGRLLWRQSTSRLWFQP